MKIETKFNTGQEVFYIEHGNIISGTITNIIIKARHALENPFNIDAFVNTVYKVNGKSLTPIEIFATPTELLKHIEKQLSNVKSQETL